MSRRRRKGRKRGKKTQGGDEVKRPIGPVPGEVHSVLKGGGGPRVPSWVMIPVGLAVGYFVASWAGAVLGGIIGIFLWRSRA